MRPVGFDLHQRDEALVFRFPGRFESERIIDQKALYVSSKP